MKRPASVRRPAPLLVTAAAVTSLVSVATAAIADYQPSPEGGAPQPETVVTTVTRLYTPPPDSPPPTNTSTTTTRSGSCSSASGPDLVPLAPQTHVGRSTSQQPTFAWFTPDVGDYTLQFFLREYLPSGSLRTIYVQELESGDRDPTGITTLSLQGADLSLAVDKTYSWNVILVCNPNRPSESLVAGADIEVVSAPSALREVLAAASGSDRARLYAESGLWYDALAESLARDDGTSVQARLLDDLASLEANAPNPAYSDRLRQVLAQLQ